MPDVRRLIRRLGVEEQTLENAHFVAPRVPGASIRARVAGLVRTFSVEQNEFEGWGMFQPVTGRIARVEGEMSQLQVSRYLTLFRPMRARLAHALRGRSWLAYPLNESDMRQRFGTPKPIVIHLVKDAKQHDSVTVRFDGNTWWFEDLDTRSDARAAEQLREAKRTLTAPADLNFKDITPEMRTCYALGAQNEHAIRERSPNPRDAKRGTELREQADYWHIEWNSLDGAQHSLAITQNELTVLSSGICLSGRDRDFDLQSLVGVVMGRDI